MPSSQPPKDRDRQPPRQESSESRRRAEDQLLSLFGMAGGDDGNSDADSKDDETADEFDRLQEILVTPEIAKFRRQFKEIGKVLDNFEGRIDGVEGRVDDVEGRISEAENKLVDPDELSQYVIQKMERSLDRRLESLKDTLLDELRRDIAQKIVNLHDSIRELDELLDRRLKAIEQTLLEELQANKNYSGEQSLSIRVVGLQKDSSSSN